MSDAHRESRLTKRADLDIGYNCNARCGFCYYWDYVNKRGDLPFSRIYKILKFISSKNIETLDITGGEPTLAKDIFRIIECAKSLGFKNICLISNAIKLSDKNFVQDLVRSGVGEFLLTLEGHDSRLHDKMVGVKGAFVKLSKATENIQQTTATLRFNTVVTGQNFLYLPQIAEVLQSFSPRNINLIHYNPILRTFSGPGEHRLRYSKSATFIKKALDILRGETFDLYVRYVPFCFLKNYEKFICNYYQIQYDQYEWDYLLRSRRQHKLLPHILKLITGFMGLYNYGKSEKLNWQEKKHRAIIKAKVIYSHRKGRACRHCCCDLICEGVWKEYARFFGTEELQTLPGAKIKNPLYFQSNS